MLGSLETNGHHQLIEIIDALIRAVELRPLLVL
jgi:hypothetical protein